MSQRVLRTRVRVTGDDGQSVVLRAGEVVPEKYQDQITNPRCYRDAEPGDTELAPIAPTKTPEPPVVVKSGETSQSPGEDDDQDAGEAGDDEGDESAPFDKEREELERIEPEVLEQAPTVQESDAESAYEKQSVTALRELCEKRGLPTTGPKRALVARLEAAPASE